MKALFTFSFFLGISTCQAGTLPHHKNTEDQQTQSPYSTHIEFDKDAWQAARTEQAVNAYLQKAMHEEIKKHEKEKLEKKVAHRGKSSLISAMIATASAVSAVYFGPKNRDGSEALAIPLVMVAIACSVSALHKGIGYFTAKKALNALDKEESTTQN